LNNGCLEKGGIDRFMARFSEQWSLTALTSLN
jgi:hypothetical protein